ncbi:MAG: transglutaminase-like cysteine peptidase [Alphaproteobacteria bacterium]
MPGVVLAHQAAETARETAIHVFARAGLAAAFGLAVLWSDPVVAAQGASGDPTPAASTATTVAISDYVPLFSTREVKSTNLGAFKQWLSVMDRYSRERKQEKGPCTDDPAICNLVEWKAFLTTVSGKDRMTQLQEVNKFMNTHPYVTDMVNWGVADYWETPKEFLDRSGDCEDYAIAKFYSLRALGMDNTNLRIVVLQDMNLQVPHAILVAYLDGKPMVLDNQIPQVVDASIIHHYRPYYSINEEYWWLHRPE